MKRLLLLMMLLPGIVSSQYKYLKLETKQVTFEKKFNAESVPEVELKKRICAFVPTIKGITDFYNGEEVITARFKDAYIDYRIYGGKWINSPVMLNHPFSANVSIVWRDSAYKVTISNIVFHIEGLGDSMLDDLITKKKATEFNKGEWPTKAGKYIEDYFSDVFQLKASKKDW
jgi:hypothetical protein